MFKKMSKLYPLGTKNKTKKIVRMKTSLFIFKGLNQNSLYL